MQKNKREILLSSKIAASGKSIPKITDPISEHSEIQQYTITHENKNNLNRHNKNLREEAYSYDSDHDAIISMKQRLQTIKKMQKQEQQKLQIQKQKDRKLKQSLTKKDHNISNFKSPNKNSTSHTNIKRGNSKGEQIKPKKFNNNSLSLKNISDKKSISQDYKKLFYHLTNNKAPYLFPSQNKKKVNIIKKEIKIQPELLKPKKLEYDPEMLGRSPNKRFSIDMENSLQYFSNQSQSQKEIKLIDNKSKIPYRFNFQQN